MVSYIYYIQKLMLNKNGSLRFHIEYFTFFFFVEYLLILMIIIIFNLEDMKSLKKEKKKSCSLGYCKSQYVNIMILCNP